MYSKFARLACPICFSLLLGLTWDAVASPHACAETVTHFGDFGDGFGSIPIPYSSDTPYVPGGFVSLLHEGVGFIPKFDESLGTLTDITIFVGPPDTASPIFYTLGGSMTVKKTDLGAPGYGGSVSLLAGLGLTYKEGSGAIPVIEEALMLVGDDAGAPTTTEFTTSVTPLGADGMLTGAESIFAFVDLDDFVGPGIVDTLFVDLIIEDTADFALDNATATASLSFDVFDSDSGIDDAVIGITYTYSITSVPEPTAFGSLTMLAGVFLVRRRRRR